MVNNHFMNKVEKEKSFLLKPNFTLDPTPQSQMVFDRLCCCGLKC